MQRFNRNIPECFNDETFEYLKRGHCRYWHPDWHKSQKNSPKEVSYSSEYSSSQESFQSFEGHTQWNGNYQKLGQIYNNTHSYNEFTTHAFSYNFQQLQENYISCMQPSMIFKKPENLQNSVQFVHPIQALVINLPVNFNSSHPQNFHHPYQNKNQYLSQNSQYQPQSDNDDSLSLCGNPIDDEESNQTSFNPNDHFQNDMHDSMECISSFEDSLSVSHIENFSYSQQNSNNPQPITGFVNNSSFSELNDSSADESSEEDSPEDDADFSMEEDRPRRYYPHVFQGQQDFSLEYLDDFSDDENSDEDDEYETTFNEYFERNARYQARNLPRNGDQEEDPCIICLDPLRGNDQEMDNQESENMEEEREVNYVVELFCRHIFHEQCIVNWLSMNPKCPMCRKDFRRDPEQEQV